MGFVAILQCPFTYVAHRSGGNFKPKNVQVNENGHPYPQLPPIWNTTTNTVDPHFPTNLPNAPFNLNQSYDASHPGYMLTDIMGDIVHRFQWLICACSPTDTGASTPAPSSAGFNNTTTTPLLSQFSVVTPGGNVTTDANYTPDGYGVNTTRSIFLRSAGNTNLHTLLPPQNQKTIGDLLDAAHVDWTWYSDGYKKAAAGRPQVI